MEIRWNWSLQKRKWVAINIVVVLLNLFGFHPSTWLAPFKASTVGTTVTSELPEIVTSELVPENIVSEVVLENVASEEPENDNSELMPENVASEEPENVTSELMPENATSTEVPEDPMMKCRSELENWLDPKIKHWIDQNLPMLDWVSVLPNGMLHIHFGIANLQGSFNQTVSASARAIPSYKWYCGTDTYQEATTLYKVARTSVFFLRCNRTSILHHLKVNNASSSGEENHPTIMAWSPKLGPEKYNLQPMVDCDTIEQSYGKPKDHINVAMCSVLYGDDWTAMMPSFAEYYTYHKMLGVQHFWVFVNTEVRPAEQPLPTIDDVTFIPYNYRWKKYGDPGIPYAGVSVWQEAMQNQCLVRLRRYGVDWVTTIDVDELLEIRQKDARAAEYPLRAFLTQYTDDAVRKNRAKLNNSSNIQPIKGPVAGIKMMNVPFLYNTKKNLERAPFHMSMDFTYRLNSTHASWVDKSRPKLIYNLKNCDASGVHWCRRYKSGNVVVTPDAIQNVMLHHLKTAVRTAIAANVNPSITQWLGQGNGGKFIEQDSNMTDTYRTKVCLEMIRGPFATFLTHLDEAICSNWPPLRITNQSSSL